MFDAENPVEYVFKSMVVDREKRIISGIATVEKIDREYDIMDRESILKVFEDYMNNPVVLMYHDKKRPVAKVTRHQKDVSKSLAPAIRVWVQHGFSKDHTDDVEKSWELIEQGILNAFSVRILPSYTRKNGRITRVYAKELAEISYVALPGNAETLIDTIVKSLGNLDDGVINMDDKTLTELLKGFKDGISSELIGVKEYVSKELADIKKSIPAAAPSGGTSGEPEILTLEKALDNKEFKKDLDTFIEDKIKNSVETAYLNKALGGTEGEDNGDEDKKKKEPASYGVSELDDYIKSLED